MANWKNNIEIEVRLPYTTQICTLDYLTAKINVTNEDIWFSGVSLEDFCWKAYIRWGDYTILIIGKATTKDGKTAKTTTYKVSAWCTCNGFTKGKESYKAKVVSYN